MLERRKRFWRRIVILLVATVATVLAVLASRDAQHLRAVQKEGKVVADALQGVYAEQRELPLLFPMLQEPHRGLQQRYFFNMFYVDQQAWRQQVGVCCLKNPVPFFVLSDGRVVVLFDGERFSSQWMTESEFQAAAESLGFDSSLLRK